MTMGIEGGMIGPMTADAAVSAAAKLGVYLPSCVIIACIILPEPAASAMAEPGHAGKDDALHDIDLRQSAPEAADQRIAEAQQPFRHAARVHQLGGEDEQRNGEQDVARIHAVEQLLRGRPHVETGEIEVEDRSADHGMADRQAETD